MKEYWSYKNLRIETLEQLREFLRDFFECEELEVYLFGSRARGDNTAYSDVDIGILAKEDISAKMTLLRMILEESNLPYKVDLVDLSENSSLLEVVLKEGERWL